MKIYRPFVLSSLLIGAFLPCAAASALSGEVAAQQTDTLGVATYSLDELVVTGTRVPRLLEDSPVQTRLITHREIERADAGNIQELLQQQLPGVEFSYAMNQQVHLNFGGFGGQSLLFLVDGERLAGETMDDVDFSRLDLADVERVEIVRGASSALYGSNAGGGVVNIITKKASRPVEASLSAKVGRHAEQRYTASLTNRFGRGRRFSNVLTGSYASMKSYDVHSAPNPQTRVVSTIYGHRTWNVAERLSWQPLAGLTFTGRAGFFFRQIPRVVDAPERYRDYTAGLKGEWLISASDRLELSYSFDQYDKSDYRTASGLDVRSYSNVQNSVRTFWSHSLKRGDELSAGAEYRYDYLLNTRLAAPKRHQTNADLFLQYDLRLGTRWEVVGTLRYDYFSDGNLHRVTPRVSALFKAVQGLNLRAAWGMGFRAPTLKEKYYDFDMAGIWIVRGNAGLRPEMSHNVNLSADYTRGAYNVTLTGYLNHIRDRISTGLPHYLPGDSRQLYLDYINQDRCMLAGLDLTLRGAWNCGLEAQLSYAYVYENVRQTTDGHPVASQYLPARPHSLTARADWHHAFSSAYDLGIGINGRFLSGVSNDEYRDYYDLSKGMTTVDYPAYTLWKLSVTQLFFGKVRLTVALDNIFNYRPRYYYLNAPLTDGINLQASLSVTIP